MTLLCKPFKQPYRFCIIVIDTTTPTVANREVMKSRDISCCRGATVPRNGLKIVSNLFSRFGESGAVTEAQKSLKVWDTLTRGSLEPMSACAIVLRHSFAC